MAYDHGIPDFVQLIFWLGFIGFIIYVIAKTESNDGPEAN